MAKVTTTKSCSSDWDFWVFLGRFVIFSFLFSIGFEKAARSDIFVKMDGLNYLNY